MLFEEIQDVFLRFGGEAGIVLVAVLVGALGDGAPQVVDLFLQVLLALLLAQAFLFGGNRIGTLIAIDPIIHQRVAGVQQVFHRIDTVALLALHDVLLGEHQVINDRTGIGPGAKQVVALEETVMPIAGMGHYQRLHADGVFFHQVRDARVGVDHDLVGQAHLAACVGLLGTEKVFPVGPMVIAQGHAHRGIGIHHLFSGDDFYLIGIGVQGITRRDTADFPVIGLDQFEGPLGTGGNGLALVLFFGGHVTNLRWKSSRKTG